MSVIAFVALAASVLQAQSGTRYRYQIPLFKVNSFSPSPRVFLPVLPEYGAKMRSCSASKTSGCAAARIPAGDHAFFVMSFKGRPHTLHPFLVSGSNCRSGCTLGDPIHRTTATLSDTLPAGQVEVPPVNDIRAHANGPYGTNVGGWCDGGDDTAAFIRTVAAIEAAQGALMEMILPAGTCRVSGVTIGSSAGDTFGFQLHGKGINYGAPDATTVSTTLLYTGRNGGTVLKFENCEWCNASDLTIDGNGLAGRGLEVVSDPNYSGQKSEYVRVAVRNVTQSPYYDYDIGGTDNPGGASGDISSNTFSDLTAWISPNGQGIHQFGSQTVTNLYSRIHFLAPNSTTPNQPLIGFHAEEGDVKLQNCDWINNGQEYDIVLEPYVYNFAEYGDYHEDGSAPSGASTRPPVWAMWGNSAVVSTSGTTATLQQLNTTPLYGEDFFNIPNDGTGMVHINGVQYTVAAGSVVAPYNRITLTTSAGTQTGVTLTKDNALYPSAFAPRSISSSSVDWQSTSGSGDVFYMNQQSSVKFDSFYGYGGGTPTIYATVPGGNGIEGFEVVNSYINGWPIRTSGFTYTNETNKLTGYTLYGATLTNPTVTGNQSTGSGSFRSTSSTAGTTPFGYYNGSSFAEYGTVGWGQQFGPSEPASTFGVASNNSDACIATGSECTARLSHSNGNLSLLRGGYSIKGAVAIPNTTTGHGGSGTLVTFSQICTTGTIKPSSFVGGRATGTCTLGTPATGHTGIATASDGSVQGNVVAQVGVRGIVATVALTTVAAGSTAAKTYNVIVF